MKPSEPISTLPWTGERMVPNHSDAATEMYHWQRYLYFRPWYEGAKVVDAASGEGYGTAYAGYYAESAKGFDISDEATQHSTGRYPWASFETHDVCTLDYSDADLVVSFETIEHVPDPEQLLRAFATCNGRIVISTPNRKTHSPGNKLEDKPFNPHHTIEWTPNEFAELVNKVFRGRQVRFLSQEVKWPGNIIEGLDDDAMYCIAVIGEGELPQWPSLGVSIPTLNNTGQCIETMASLSRLYPGRIHFAVTANGTEPANLEKLRQFRDSAPYMCTLIESAENEGYGIGANRGLDALKKVGFDLYAVSNDDVLAMPTTLCELVRAYQELKAGGQNVGLVAPVSNKVAGQQQVDVGEFETLEQLHYLTELYHEKHKLGASQHVQIRGLFFIASPELIDTIGGFDPRFNYGNFEDDDFNLRSVLAGFSNWIAEGAYLFHYGSQTFASMNQEKEYRYQASIERNAEIFQWKWDLQEIELWPQIDYVPDGVSLHVPLDATWEHGFTVNCEGLQLDLYSQVSDVEFAKWVFDRLKARDRSVRQLVAEVLLANKYPTEAVVETLDSKSAAA